MVGDHQQRASRGEVLLAHDLQIGEHGEDPMGQALQQSPDQTPTRIPKFLVNSFSAHITHPP
jgi:hypothetical protein